jgi:hypothetical protein
VIEPPATPQHVTIAEPMAASEAISDLPLLDYDARSPAYIVASLRGFSQRELQAVDLHESENGNRAEIRDRIAELSGSEPWIGYDGQETSVIMRFVRKAGTAQAREVHAYERTHRDRGGIVAAAEKRLASRPA